MHNCHSENNQLNGIFFGDVQNSLLINCSSLQNGGSGVIITDSNSILITESTINGNIIGINITMSESISINNSLISDSRNESFSISEDSNDLWIFNNKIIGNGTFIFSKTSDGAHILNASRNFWGDDSGPYHPEYHPGGNGHKISGNVIFEPWLDEQGNLVYFPDASDEDESTWSPLYILLGLLAALLTALVITIRIPELQSTRKPSQLSPPIPSWDSSDVVNIKGNMITCEHCHQGFDVAKNENAIRLSCPHCGQNTRY